MPDGRERDPRINRFELLIDWGWFYFITKPMFLATPPALPVARQLRSRDPRHGFAILLGMRSNGYRNKFLDSVTLLQ
jgi:hypothetical protein